MARLRPLKRFGQHFLTDPRILARIQSAMDVGLLDTVVEIGPGRGALTLGLARRVKYLLAVEIDRGWAAALKERSKEFPNMDVREADILRFDIARVCRDLKVKEIVIVGNIPYNITTPILERLVFFAKHLRDTYLTIQKEVAQRLVARPRTAAYGSLTCFINYYFQPKVLFSIKAGSFSPAPKVDSAFVRLTPWKAGARPWKPRSEKIFFEIIRAGFQQRRKCLKSALASKVGRDILDRLGSDPILARRAEELSLEDFERLADLVFDTVHAG
jgi:16S rRNA (adenine1518-N6/adenine1519-N6)-dimethyltransferase